MSNLQVFVTFPESTAVFAGETLHCTITFRNVAQKPNSAGSLSLPKPNGYGAGGTSGERRAKPQVSVNNDPRRSGKISPRPRVPSAGTKTSFSQPPKSSQLPLTPSTIPPTGRPNARHKRSISIVSLNSDLGKDSGGRGIGDAEQRLLSAQHRSRGHGRSASLQLGSSRHSAPNSATKFSSPGRTPTTPMIAETETMAAFSFPVKSHGSPTPEVTRHSRSMSVNKAFSMAPPVVDSEARSSHKVRNLSVDTNDVVGINKEAQCIGLLKPSADDSESDQAGSSRVIAAHSIEGETPRCSGEFYSMSNSTTETLLSDYHHPKMLIPRTPKLSSHSRRHSLLSMESRAETLMMGYAQIYGSFILDGSLVQTSIFDEVKRKGVVGTQNGGGVVGIDTNKSESGFLSGLGWGGLTGLLGGNNMSTLAEMKSIASTRSIPILSTPQSILFVDLQLAPGESRSYKYKITLPEGLPPSHRGKAIKIMYNLVVGTQRPGKGVVEPKVVEIPFRVFSNVDGSGIMPLHDLMSPIVLLRDEATTGCVEDRLDTSPILKQSPKQESSHEDFLSYVDNLLQSHSGSPCHGGSFTILSPTFTPTVKRFSIYEDHPTTSKDAIEMALLIGSNRPGNGNCSVFEVARNGYRVATATLTRPAYKLGEVMTAVIDFSNAEIPCYHIHTSLETSEKVNSSIALRSASSIHRATRKIYAQHSESTLFANRITVNATIPASATPEFSTSAVSIAWVLRLEFITPAVSSSPGASISSTIAGLLEQTFLDDRGEVYEPRQTLLVESFDAHIPIRVYPNGSDPGIVGGIIGAQIHAAETAGFAV